MIFEIVPYGVEKLSRSFEAKLKKKFDLKIKPHFINWIVTYRCDSRCQMCNIWQKYLLKPNLVKEELSLAEIKKFLRDNKDFLSEVEHLGLTGGEFFLRPDAVQIIKLVREVLPQVATGPQTNGLAVREIRKKLAEIVKFYPEVSIAVSLDGMGKTHDKIRGIKGAFEKATETIKYARKLGIERVTCGMTLGNQNYREILPVRDFVEGLGCEFSCFLPDEAGYFGNIGKGLKLSSEARKEIIKVLKDNFGHHYYMDNLRRQMEGTRKRTLPCYSGYYSITIDPYGNVLPCILKNEPFGNIREATLEEILYGEKARKLKNKLEKCVCWSQCEVSTSIMADGTDLLRWLPYCSDKKRFFNKVSEIKDGVR